MGRPCILHPCQQAFTHLAQLVYSGNKVIQMICGAAVAAAVESSEGLQWGGGELSRHPALLLLVLLPLQLLRLLHHHGSNLLLNVHLMCSACPRLPEEGYR